MSLSRSWQFVGSVNSPWYRIYDWLRRRVNRHLVSFLSSHLHADRSGERGHEPVLCCRVLEAGSGTAVAASLFKQRTEVSLSACMDLDQDALIEARRRDPRLRAVVGDLLRIPFADGSFTLVFNNSTIEHLDHPVEAIREMSRVCATSGRVFVGVPYAGGPLWVQRAIAHTAIGRWLGRAFSRSELDALLREAGLRPIATIHLFFNFFVGSVGVKPLAASTLSQPGGRP